MQPTGRSTRDKETGRYKHVWCFSAEQPIQGREFATCENCDKVQVYGGDRPDRTYSNFETAVRTEARMFPTFDSSGNSIMVYVPTKEEDE